MSIWIDLVIPIVTGTILFYIINIVFSSIIEFRQELSRTYSLLIYYQNKLLNSFDYNNCTDGFKSEINFMQSDIRKRWSELESKYYTVRWLNKFAFLKIILTDKDFKDLKINLLLLSNSCVWNHLENNELDNRLNSLNKLIELFEKYKIKVKES